MTADEFLVGTASQGAGVGCLAGPLALRHSRRVSLPDEASGPTQSAILKALSPGRRWEIARSLYWSARRLKTAFVRQEHPDWSDEDVDDYVRRVFLHGRP